MIYALWKNFQVLERPRDAQLILFWGALFFLTLLLFSPFLPDWAEIAAPIASSFGASSIAANHQMRKEDILASQDYELQTAANVAAVALLSFLALVVIIVALVSILVSTGVIEP